MWVVAIFVIGYVAIVLEHPLRLNKAASALIAGGLCWTAYMLGADADDVNGALLHHLGELSQILFFLLGAMTIVELIDAHDGFELITSRVTTRSRRKLLVIITLFSFFLSAVLDNLTTALIMSAVILAVGAGNVRFISLAFVNLVVAANAGGAWSAFGDITTLMVWLMRMAA